MSNSTTAAIGVGTGGGGIANTGGLTLTNVTVTGNTTTGASSNGGGLLNSPGATTTINGGSFSMNTTVRAGGAVENDAGTVNAFGTKFDMNTAGVNGGALHISGAGSSTFSGVTVTNNTAVSEGGGLWNSKTGILIISDISGNVLISGNTAAGDAAIVGGDFTTLQGGGGIFNDGNAKDGSGGTLTIIDTSLTNSVTISNNLATGANRGSGGGILTIGGKVGHHRRDHRHERSRPGRRGGRSRHRNGHPDPGRPDQQRRVRGRIIPTAVPGNGGVCTSPAMPPSPSTAAR